MDEVAVTDELAAALEVIPGLRVSPFPLDRITPPTAMVGWPARTYDITLRRGADQLTVPVLVAVAATDPRVMRETLAPYRAGSGPMSVKAALHGGTYTACDAVRVTEARTEPVSIADVVYMAAIFDVIVIGGN